MKVNGPGFSLDASGSLGGAIVASKWKGRNYFRVLVTPSNPKSGGQVGNRAMFKFLSQKWKDIDASDQSSWDALADQRVVSPFNAYMGANQQHWRNFEAPSKASDFAKNGTLGTVANEAATAGVKQITYEAEITAANDNWGLMIFRGLASSLVPSPSNCIAVILADDAAVYTYVDTPLTADTYYYNSIPFTYDGVLGSAGTEVNATVT